MNQCRKFYVFVKKKSKVTATYISLLVILINMLGKTN